MLEQTHSCAHVLRHNTHTVVHMLCGITPWRGMRCRPPHMPTHHSVWWHLCEWRDESAERAHRRKSLRELQLRLLSQQHQLYGWGTPLSATHLSSPNRRTATATTSFATRLRPRMRGSAQTSATSALGSFLCVSVPLLPVDRKSEVWIVQLRPWVRANLVNFAMWSTTLLGKRVLFRW